MIAKKEWIAMLLAGGQGSRLYALTRNVAKPAVPFGGKYRIIDFPLSNCVNSGIDTVGVLTQYQPLELNEYIGNGQPWDLDRIHGGVYVLPPYQKISNSNWYTGTANPSIRTSTSSTAMIRPTSSSFRATTSTRWTIPRCWNSTRKSRRTAPSPLWRCRGSRLPALVSWPATRTRRSMNLPRSQRSQRATWPRWASTSSPGAS